MKPMGRKSAMALVAAAGLLALDLWAYCALDQRRETAGQLTADLVACRQLEARINALKEQPPLAFLGSTQTLSLGRQLDAAASSAGIPAVNIVRVEPAAAHRLGETAYWEEPTNVSLRAVTLEQLTRFLHQLSSKDSRIHVRDLHLGATPEEQGERWTAEVTLANYLYTPKQGVQASPQEKSNP
jgi:hypothetical protein